MTRHDEPDRTRATSRRPDLSKMTTAEKIERIAKSLAQSKRRIEEQSRMVAELRRRMDPNAPPVPKLGLRTLDEVKAYVDRIAKGVNETPD